MCGLAGWVTGWEQGLKGRAHRAEAPPAILPLTVASPLVSCGSSGGPCPAPHCQTGAEGLERGEETPEAR